MRVVPVATKAQGADQDAPFSAVKATALCGGCGARVHGAPPRLVGDGRVDRGRQGAADVGGHTDACLPEPLMDDLERHTRDGCSPAEWRSRLNVTPSSPARLVAGLEMR